MSCSLPTCQIYTKSLRGVKYYTTLVSVHSLSKTKHVSLIRKPQDGWHAQGFPVLTVHALYPTLLLQLNVKISHLPSPVDWLQINSHVFQCIYIYIYNFTLENYLS